MGPLWNLLFLVPIHHSTLVRFIAIFLISVSCVDWLAELDERTKRGFPLISRLRDREDIIMMSDSTFKCTDPARILFAVNTGLLCGQLLQVESI